jgi:hypothetical protein
MVLIELGLGDPHRLLEVFVGQLGVDDGVAVSFEIGRLHAAWDRVPTVEEEDRHGAINLTMLYLEGTKVTDAGLVHLEGLNQLEAVNLNNTKVTDVGIEHLHGLTKLRFLWISGTQVTNAGREKLRSALPNCNINTRYN